MHDRANNIEAIALPEMDDYLQVHCNALLVPNRLLQYVKDGLEATGCSARISDVGDFALARYSDGPGRTPRRGMFAQHLVAFESSSDADRFQSWLDETEELRRGSRQP